MGLQEIIEKTLDKKRGYKYHTYQTNYDSVAILGGVTIDIFSLYHYGTLIFRWDLKRNTPTHLYEISTSDSCAVRKAMHAMPNNYFWIRQHKTYGIRCPFYGGVVPINIDDINKSFYGVKSSLSFYRWRQVLKWLSEMAHPFLFPDTTIGWYYRDLNIEGNIMREKENEIIKAERSIEDAYDNIREDRWNFDSCRKVTADSDGLARQFALMRKGKALRNILLLWIHDHPLIPFPIIKAGIKRGQHLNSNGYIIDITLFSRGAIFGGD